MKEQLWKVIGAERCLRALARAAHRSALPRVTRSSARIVARVHSGGLPYRGDTGEEARVVEPGILKAKVGRLGNRGRDGGQR